MMSGFRVRMGLFLPIVLLGLYGLGGCDAQAPGPGVSAEWPYVVRFGGVSLNVEVALGVEAQRRGLMFRDSLDENSGMLFVYDREQEVSFWMKNTAIPLSIAFMDGDLVVRDIQDMTPFSEKAHVSRVPAMYALEVNRGWFSRRGVTTGVTAKFSPQLQALLALQADSDR